MCKQQSCKAQKNLCFYSLFKKKKEKKTKFESLSFSNKGHTVCPSAPSLPVLKKRCHNFSSFQALFTSLQHRKSRLRRVLLFPRVEKTVPSVNTTEEPLAAAIGLSGKFYKCGKINRDNCLGGMKTAGKHAEQCSDWELLPDGRNSNTSRD